MVDPACAEMRLLIQADHDGELSPAEAAPVAAHLAQCPACAAWAARLKTLSGQIKRDAPYFNAPPKLHAELRKRTALGRRFPALGMSFGAGFAAAASIALLLLAGRPATDPDLIVTDHIRALQPGHMMDVVSTDQHNVKPWFDGRVDFAPPVKDLKQDGFPLTGGRLDYLAGRPVAAIVYARRQHQIDLFVWPQSSTIDLDPATGSRNGYNFRHWRQNGMVFWAVSDLNAVELGQFEQFWHAR